MSQRQIYTLMQQMYNIIGTNHREAVGAKEDEIKLK